jgi:hypothetical protein
MSRALAILNITPAARNFILWGTLMLLGCLHSSASQSVTLAWSPSPDTNAIGYKIYYGGASHNYTNAVTLGVVTNTTISGLTEGATYYFAATTLDSTGPESAFSNEAAYSIPNIAPSAAPTFDAPANMTIYQNAGLQQWSINNVVSGLGDNNQSVSIQATTSDASIISQPLVNYPAGNTSGTLTFAPAAALGAATVTVTVSNGAAGTSKSFTVTVVAPPVTPVVSVPPAPAFDVPANITVYQNAAAQQTAVNTINSGLADSNQNVTVSAVTSDPTIVPDPVVSYNPGDNFAVLSIAPVAGALGTATVTVTVSNGLASTSQNFTVAVVPPNLAPTLNAISNVAVFQNSGVQTVSLTGITSGSPAEDQVLTVSAESDNRNVAAQLVVSYASPNATGTLAFAPVGTGTANIRVTVNDGAESNNLVSQVFSVTVLPPTNLPPTLDPIANVALLQGTSSRTITLTGIGAGSVTNVQWPRLTVSSSNTRLIPTPAVHYTSQASTATLTLRSGGSGIGTATITVTVNNGARSNNSIRRTFQVTVVPNRAPTLDFIPNLTVSAGSGPQTITLTGITSGSPTEMQTLRVSAASSNPQLMPIPGVQYASPGTTAQLTLRPGTRLGSATITVTVNDGGMNNSTVRQRFTVTVVPPNTNSPSNTAVANAMAGTVTQIAQSGTLTTNQPAVLGAASVNNGKFSFQVSGTSGARCIVEVSSDFSHWSPVETNAVPFVYSESRALGGNRFFRAHLTQ